MCIHMYTYIHTCIYTCVCIYTHVNFHLFSAVLGLHCSAQAFCSCSEWGLHFLLLRLPATVASLVEHRL